MSQPALFFIVGAKDDTGAVVDAVEKRLKEMRSEAKDTEGVFLGMGEAIKGLFETIGIGLSVTELVSKLREAVTAAGEFGEQIQKAGQRTGLSAATLSTLHYAAKVTGSDFDGLASATGKLGANLGAAASGNKKLEEAFQSMGLNAKELAGREDGVEVALRAVARTMSDGTTPANRLLLAKTLLGKAGQELIPVLMEVGENFDDFREKATAAGVQLDAVRAKHLEEFNRKLNDMRERAQGAGLAFAEGLLPALDELAVKLTGSTSHLQAWEQIGRGVGASAFFLASGLQQVWSALEGVVALGGLAVTSIAELGVALAGLQSRLMIGFDPFAKQRDFLGKTGDDFMHQFHKGFTDGEALSQEGHDLWSGKGAQSGRPSFYSWLTDPNNPAFRKGGGWQPPEGMSGDGNKGEDKARAAEQKYLAARAADAMAAARLQAAVTKAGFDEQLALLDSAHKQMLVSDESYYARKEDLQRASLDAEIGSALSSREALEKEIGALNAEKVKGPAAKERDAKVLELKAKEKELDAQIAKLTGEEDRNTAELAANLYEAAQAKQKMSDDLAAELETERGTGTTARHKQADDAFAQKRAKAVVDYGAGSDEVKELDALHRVESAKIEIAALDQRMAAIQTQAHLAELQAQEQVLSGQQTQMEGDRAIAAARAEEVRQLQALQGEYARYAGDVGQAGAEAEAKIAEAITQTQEAMKKQKTELASLSHAVIDPLIEGTGTLSQRWKQVGENIRRAIEQAMDNELVALITGQPGAGVFAGAGLPGARGAGQPSKSGVAGLFGDLMHLGHKGAMGVGDAAASALRKGDGGVAVQIINESPVPLTGTATQGQGQNDMFDSKVISVILKGAEEGASWIQALAGGSGLLG